MGFAKQSHGNSVVVLNHPPNWGGDKTQRALTRSTIIRTPQANAKSVKVYECVLAAECLVRVDMRLINKGLGQ
jgi:hypothetical protein